MGEQDDDDGCEFMLSSDTRAPVELDYNLIIYIFNLTEMVCRQDDLFVRRETKK